MTNCATQTPLAEVVTSEISIPIATLSPYQILLCIIHTVITQLYFQGVINNYIGYNYMFRPCVLAIIWLSLDWSSNYTISGVFWAECWGGGGGGGGTRSHLYNSGWHNPGLHKITIKLPFTLNQFTTFKIIIS